VNERELLTQAFEIKASEVSMRRGHNSITKWPFTFDLLSNSLLPRQSLRLRIEHGVIDQSNHIKMHFLPFMLVLAQADYTYILRSLDLNMNYTDGLLKEFFFDKYTAIEEFFKKLTGVVGMRIDIQFDQMAMMLLHQDKSSSLSCSSTRHASIRSSSWTEPLTSILKLHSSSSSKRRSLSRPQ